MDLVESREDLARKVAAMVVVMLTIVVRRLSSSRALTNEVVSDDAGTGGLYNEVALDDSVDSLMSSLGEDLD